MQFLKRINPLFLSFTLIASCLIFQIDTFIPTATSTPTTWIVTQYEVTSNQDVYHLKLKKAQSIIGNNFSIFSFKCFLKQRKSLFASQYKQQHNLHLPEHTEFLKLTQQITFSEEHHFIG